MNPVLRYWNAVTIGPLTGIIVALFWVLLIVAIVLGVLKKLRHGMRAVQLAWCCQCGIVLFNGFRVQNTMRSGTPDLAMFLLELSNVFLMLEVATAGGLIALLVLVATNWNRRHVLDYTGHAIILLLLWSAFHMTQAALLGKRFFGRALF